ncbi:hypothetical protein TNCV_3231601 [Trichonephila clavipes]|nr:hypothetical protein TNCV_3231601 [Trichonephila clavipes]
MDDCACHSSAVSIEVEAECRLVNSSICVITFFDTSVPSDCPIEKISNGIRSEDHVGQKRLPPCPIQQPECTIWSQ